MHCDWTRGRSRRCWQHETERREPRHCCSKTVASSTRACATALSAQVLHCSNNDWTTARCARPVPTAETQGPTAASCVAVVKQLFVLRQRVQLCHGYTHAVGKVSFPSSHHQDFPTNVSQLQIVKHHHLQFSNSSTPLQNLTRAHTDDIASVHRVRGACLTPGGVSTTVYCRARHCCGGCDRVRARTPAPPAPRPPQPTRVKARFAVSSLV